MAAWCDDVEQDLEAIRHHEENILWFGLDYEQERDIEWDEEEERED